MGRNGDTNIRTYNSQATKSRIFEAAALEFAQYGIAGARIDRIAAQAQANKQLIYSYFGNKEELFAAVLQQKLEQLAAAIVVDPERVPEYIGELFDFHVANPETIRLLLWEGLYYGPKPVPNEGIRTEHYRQKVAAIAASQFQGKTDSALDPRHISFILLSLAGWWFTVPQIARMQLVDDADASAALARHRAHVVEAARRILSPLHVANELPNGTVASGSEEAS